MSLSTFSVFYYDFETDSDHRYINFDEGSGELTADIELGAFTPTELAEKIKTAMDAVGTLTYVVSFNRSNRTFTISSSAPFDLLVTSGSSFSSSAFPVIGFTGADRTGASTYTGAECGDFYLPQFVLQDYVSDDDHQKMISPSINRSASGKVEVIRFGVEKFITMNIKFATNKAVAADFVHLRKNPTGVEDLRRFMQYIIQKKPVEFMPDELDRSILKKVLLESTPEEKDGTGYQLKELYGKGLPGFFETGKIVFRLIED